MKFLKLTSLFLSATLILAADESTLDVPSIISTCYPTTPTLSPAASATLASLLNSIETSWHANSAYTLAETAIVSAAPSSLKASIDKSGYDYKDIVTMSWYTKSVDKGIQSAVAAQISAVDSAGYKIVGTPTSTGGMGRVTGLGVAGVVGVVGGVLGLFCE